MPDKSRPRLPFQFKLYVWIYLFFIAFLPLVIVIGKADKYPWLLSYFWYVVGWPVISSFIYWYTSRRCSSPQLRFFDGLVYITLAMNIGWQQMSLFSGFFGVLAALVISPFAALYGDYRLEQEYASKFFHKMVVKFYKRGLFTGEAMERNAASRSATATKSDDTPPYWPGDYGPGWEGEPIPAINQEPIDSYVGKYILVGITYCDSEGKELFQQQLHGVIEQASRDGILISLRGRYAGKKWNMPPILSGISEGKPGVYNLTSTGEEVKDPDLLRTWTITRPKVH
jgi:hypothetical protein